MYEYIITLINMGTPLANSAMAIRSNLELDKRLGNNHKERL